jgi:hypothetical protein
MGQTIMNDGSLAVMGPDGSHDDGGAIRIGVVDEYESETGLANARLIAEAPAMLALIRVLADSQADDPENIAAREIIARIEDA